MINEFFHFMHRLTAKEREGKNSILAHGANPKPHS